MKRVLLLVFLLLNTIPALAYYHHESPINWREYNQESFDLAEKENKPVFMLITAIWCYWCHVYRDETLHTPEISSYVNEHFIPVFVDADKRQDLTRQYLAGGWPSTVIFSPNGEEVNRINGMIRKEELLAHLKKVAEHFESGQTYTSKKQVFSFERSSITQKELDDFWNRVPLELLASYDKEYGGFGTDRKFPLGRIYEFFLYRYNRTEEPILLEATELALDKMAPENWLDEDKPIEERVLRGIYDPIEGGFFRYNLNRDWSVPHYEKLLDSNAYLIRAYLLAYKITGKPRYREIAEHSLTYVITSLQDTDTGRLYGSQDAGHEKYYRQTREERTKEVYESRPRIDTTTYSDWSGPMITTFFIASDILGNETYAKHGLKAAEFFKNELVGDGVLHFYDGSAQLNGLLLDNGEIASAFLDVYSATNDEQYLNSAELIIKFADERLYNASAGAYYERNSTDTHLYRKNDAFLADFPIEGNTAMAFALIKAHKETGKQEYLERARSVMGYLIKNPGGLEELASQTIIADYLRKEDVSLEFEREPVKGSFIILLFVAFISGLLSFLSPCTLPLLPAYAVHTLKAKHDAVKRTLAFFLGLALVFSILGVSVALVGQMLTKHIPQISRFAGIIIILFGILTIIGKGFRGFRLKRLQDGIVGSFLFGTSYGVAWTPCVGPILGSIFVLAAASNSWTKGGLLLFVYAIGIAIPLLALSYYVDKLHHEGKVWKFLRGKEISFSIGRLRIHTHTTNLIAGLLLIIIGFLIFSGTLYSINRFALETPLQQKLFGLENWLLNLIK
jgi:hypothetical protein